MKNRGNICEWKYYGESIAYARNLIQLQLAETVSVSGNYISQVERGFKSVSFPTLVQIAEILGVEEKDLLDFSRKKGM